jgi:hypothetical protein
MTPHAGPEKRAQGVVLISGIERTEEQLRDSGLLA